MGWLDALHPDDRARFVERCEAAIASGLSIEQEARMRGADGQYRWLSFRSVPLRDRAGRIVKWYGKSSDIEDRKRAEEEHERLRELEAELAHTNRVSMLGELTASVAHEVNQPLTGIVSNGSACLRLLADESSPAVDEAREALRDIVRDGRRAGDVIARIRAMTRRAPALREPVDLTETIPGVLVLVKDEAAKIGMSVETRFADQHSLVISDRVQLQQVVLNLVMNAMEAMSAVSGPRRLVIETRKIEGGQTQVTIEDSGVGLQPGTESRMFDPFYTTKSAGMGMGLSICRSIVQNNGGRLRATANEGAGTSFHFTVPTYSAGGNDAGSAAG